MIQKGHYIRLYSNICDFFRIGNTVRGEIISRSKRKQRTINQLQRLPQLRPCTPLSNRSLHRQSLNDAATTYARRWISAGEQHYVYQSAPPRGYIVQKSVIVGRVSCASASLIGTGFVNAAKRFRPICCLVVGPLIRTLREVITSSAYDAIGLPRP